MDSKTRQHLKKWLVRAAWLGLALDVTLWLLLADVPIQSLGLLLLLALIQVMGLWLCLGILAVRYRRWVGTWYGLAGAILLLSLARWGGGGESSPFGVSLATLATMGAVVALPLSMILLLWKRDVSVVLIGLAALAFVWGIFLASRPYGDPLRAWLLATVSESGQFWWFDTLSCLLTNALLWGGLAFVVHFVRLVVKEIQGQ